MPIGTIIIAVLIFLTLFLSFVTIQQGFIGVTTIFGKFNRILRPGLNFKIPFIEKVYKRVSIQNRSSELGFQAVTIDQATVNFTAMLLYAVLNAEEETVKNVAFKFVDDRNFMQALVRSVEGSVIVFLLLQKNNQKFSL